MKKKDILKERMKMLKDSANKKYTNTNYLQQRLKDDNSVKIDVVLPKNYCIFNQFAPSSYSLLNQDIYQYIEEQAYFIPSEYNLIVNFIGSDFSDEEKNKIEQAVHDHYNLNIYDKLDDIRRNRFLGIFLLIFGAIALALYFFMTLFNHNLVMLEIISIVGTFSIWESVNCWLIQGNKRKIDLHVALQMGLIKVVFNDENNC